MKNYTILIELMAQHIVHFWWWTNKERKTWLWSLFSGQIQCLFHTTKKTKCIHCNFNRKICVILFCVSVWNVYGNWFSCFCKILKISYKQNELRRLCPSKNELLMDVDKAPAAHTFLLAWHHQRHNHHCCCCHTHTYTHHARSHTFTLYAHTFEKKNCTNLLIDCTCLSFFQKSNALYMHFYWP